ncbi:MAG: nucleotidyltransferase domain-containing protein [Thermoflexia bacterium]|nr:MAG: nucleotidyltransferase domain-containing protein [Thermoflexia bacterium]
MDRAENQVLEIVERFLQALEKSGIRLSAAYLYGSYAGGAARPDSDIDVALVSEDFTGDWLEDHRRILSALLQSDSRIEPVSFRPEEFRDEHPLVWEIRAKGRRLR